MILTARKKCPTCGSTDHQEWGPPLYPQDFMPLWGLYDEAKLATNLGQLQAITPNGIRLSRCSHCRMVFANKIPDSELTEFIYDELLGDGERSYARTEHSDKQYLRIRISRMLFELGHFLQGKVGNFSLLDFGCGWGDLMAVMAANGIQVQGVELSSHKRSHIENRNYAVASRLEDVQVTPPYDLILMWQVLEHVSDPVTLLKSLSAIAHDKTGLLIGVPHFTERRLKVEFQAPPAARSKDLNPFEHVNYFDGDTLTRTAYHAGWERIYTMHPLLNSPLWLPSNNRYERILSTLRQDLFFTFRFPNVRRRNIALGTYAVFVLRK